MEELQNKILELEGKISELETEIETKNTSIEEMKTSNDELTERNRKLEEHNQKLFLRASATYSTDNTGSQQNEEVPKVSIKEFADNLSKDEINILNELIEGEY